MVAVARRYPFQMAVQHLRANRLIKKHLWKSGNETRGMYCAQAVQHLRMQRTLHMLKEEGSPMRTHSRDDEHKHHHHEQPVGCSAPTGSEFSHLGEGVGCCTSISIHCSERHWRWNSMTMYKQSVVLCGVRRVNYA